jgi:hypothetical protein
MGAKARASTRHWNNYFHGLANSSASETLLSTFTLSELIDLNPSRLIVFGYHHLGNTLSALYRKRFV